jgi:hypothetical protein
MRSAAAGIAQVVLSILGALVLAGALYWTGDCLYDFGLWPAGAFLHLSALITLLGVPLYVIVVVGAGLFMLIRRPE